MPLKRGNNTEESKTKRENCEMKTGHREDAEGELARMTSAVCERLFGDCEAHDASTGSAAAAVPSSEPPLSAIPPDPFAEKLIPSVPQKLGLKEGKNETMSVKGIGGEEPTKPLSAIPRDPVAEKLMQSGGVFKRGESETRTGKDMGGEEPGKPLLLMKSLKANPSSGEDPTTALSGPASAPVSAPMDDLVRSASDTGSTAVTQQSSAADPPTESTTTRSDPPLDPVPAPLTLARHAGLARGGSSTSVGAHAVHGPEHDEEMHDGTITYNNLRASGDEESISEVDLHSQSAMSSAATLSLASGSISHFDDLIEATLVEENGAEEVVEAKPVQNKKINRTKILMLVLVLVAVVAIALAIALPRRSSGGDSDSSSADDSDSSTPATIATEMPESSSSPTAAPLPTLQRIRNDGVLRCGVVLELITDNIALEPGKENTFESQICRALAAAALGRDNYQIELVEMHLADRARMLESGTIDVLLAGLSWTMDRDVYVPDYERHYGLGYAAVYTFLTSGFGGDPTYVACTQNGLKYIGECANMKLCMLNGTRYYDSFSHQLPRGQLKLVETSTDFYPLLLEGKCNVFASTSILLNFLTTIPGASFESAKGYYASEPLSIVAHKDDHRWIDFCKYVMLGLIAAEYHNITRANVDFINGEGSNSIQPKFQRPTSFGEQYEDMFIDAVAAVGNFGEMEARSVSPILLPRQAINHVNNGTTGNIYSIPFGNSRQTGPSFDERFQEIFSREKLRCAIRTDGRAGFAQRIVNTSEPVSFAGMDVDYCLAIAAGMFTTPSNTVEFFEVQDEAMGFDLLLKGEVDVLAGVMGNMERDVKDPETGAGFSFTTPYFYNSTADGTQKGPDANLCLATREDHSGWSEYVFWIVQGTFYAEEEGITRSRANEMPTVDIYGERFTRILRDAISAVGSYGEMYSRNVEEHIPRQGMNLLADKSNPTPLFYIPPGIFQ